MKKTILLLCLLFTGIATTFAQTESIYLHPAESRSSPAFDIYGEPGTVCTLFFWGTYPAGYSGSQTFTLDESGHYRKEAILNERYTGSGYSGYSSYRIDVPEGKITKLMNIGNIKEYFSVTHSISLDSISFKGTGVEGINVSGCKKLRYLDCHYSILASLYVDGCENLQYLNCNHTKLTNIFGIADCKKLQYIDCSYTLLDSLDLSNCKELKKLFISNHSGRYNSPYGWGESRCKGLGKLNVSGCTALDSLDVSSYYYNGYDKGGLYSLNISGCTNLKYLDCRHNPITNLDASGLENLKEIYFPNNYYRDGLQVRQYALESLNVSGCTSLTSLDVSGGQDGYGARTGRISSLLVDGCTNLRTLNCRNNPLPDLNVSGCPNLELLDCSRTSLSRLNASGLTKLTSRTVLLPSTLSELDISGCTGFDTVRLSGLKDLQILNINGCTNLKYLACLNSPLSTLSATNLPNLKILDIQRTNNSIKTAMERLEVVDCDSLQWLNCNNTKLESLTTLNCSNLQTLICGNNQLTNIDVSGCPHLKSLSCGNNQLSDLDVSACLNLRSLSCTNNQLTTLDVSACQNLQSLFCTNNQLTTLDVSGLSKLTQLYTPYSIENLNISNCAKLSFLDCSNSKLKKLNATGCSGLQFLDCRNTPLESLKVSGLKKLDTLYVHHEKKSTVENNLTDLDVSGCESLQYLDCSNIGLKNLDLSNCKNLKYLDCSYDSLTSIDVRAYDSLQTLICNNNNLTTLDVSDCKKLYHLDCSYNALTTLNVKGCTGFIGTNEVRRIGVLNATQNALPLSECYSIQCQTPSNCMNYNIYNTNDQHIYMTILDEESLNLEGELTISGTTSTISGSTGDYVIEGNSLRFLHGHGGIHTLDLSNSAVLYKYKYYYNGLPHAEYVPVHVYYHVTVLNKVRTPRIKSSQDTLAPGSKVSIICNTEDAQIYYTLDGTDPSESSVRYYYPIELNESTTIKAIAVRYGWTNSDIATASFAVKDPNNNDDNDNNNDDPLTIAPRQLQWALNAYPNPCGDMLYIETSQNDKDGAVLSFRILDLQGRERLVAPGSAHQINMSRLPAGVYLLETTGKNGAVRHHKIIKR